MPIDELVNLKYPLPRPRAERRWSCTPPLAIDKPSLASIYEAMQNADRSTEATIVKLREAYAADEAALGRPNASFPADVDPNKLSMTWDRTLWHMKSLIESVCRQSPDIVPTDVVLREWLSHNKRVNRTQEAKYPCVMDAKADSYIYMYESNALYRERTKREDFRPRKDPSQFATYESAIQQADLGNPHILKLPKHWELEAFILTRYPFRPQPEARVPYTFRLDSEGEPPTVNAYLLLDMMDLFPGVTSVRYKDRLSPIYFYSPATKTDGILYPLSDYV